MLLADWLRWAYGMLIHIRKARNNIELNLDSFSHPPTIHPFSIDYCIVIIGFLIQSTEHLLPFKALCPVGFRCRNVWSPGIQQRVHDPLISHPSGTLLNAGNHSRNPRSWEEPEGLQCLLCVDAHVLTNFRWVPIVNTDFPGTEGMTNCQTQVAK